MGNSRDHNWTDDRIEQLKELHGQGLSNSQIARALGGVTRNAVIGKVTRLGLNSAKKKLPIVRKRPNFEPHMKPRPIKPRIIEGPEPASLCLSILEINDRTCKFPSDNAPYTYCGHPPKLGSPYCEYHFDKSRQPQHAPRVRAA